MFKRHKKNPSPFTWEAYKKQRNKVTSLKRKGVKTFCHNDENDRVITEPSRVAEVFNDYCANVAEVGNKTDGPADFSEHPSVKSITERKFLNNFSFNPVNSSYIRDILDHLNPKKAVGVDGISPRVLRLSAPVLVDELLPN